MQILNDSTSVLCSCDIKIFDEVANLMDARLFLFPGDGIGAMLHY